MKFLCSFYFLLFLWVFASAQIPVGSWRMHLPSNLGLHLAYSPDKVYCLAGQSLFSYKLSDNSIESLSKINGLSDFGATAIAYSDEFKLLIVGYDNGNIDLVNGKAVTNISDLKNKLLPASKAINHVLLNGKWAYLSCGFGIVLLDLEKREVKDTYVFGVNGSYIQVNSCTLLGDYIYAATPAGIYKASVTDALLVDYSRWSRINNVPNYEKSFLQVTANEGVLYAIYTDPAGGGDVLYYCMDNIWSQVNLGENTDIYHVGFSGSRIYVSTSINVKIYDKAFNLKQTIWQYPDIGPSQPRETLMDSKENLWVADFGNGLVEVRANGNVYSMMPNGPTSGNVRSFCFSNSTLYATMGGIDVSYQNLYNVGGFSGFTDDQWKSYNYSGSFDFMYAKPSPVDKDLIYITSWGNGVFAFKKGEQISHYDETNSTLQNAAPGGPNTRVWGLDFDKDNNLWVSNSLVSNSLSVMK
ncbi:MAG TPA: hypothetical protein VHO90_10005, partial [Bacteroidales bacterium]|nr:hypothetical protein [Bacteroidales bacterium]